MTLGEGRDGVRVGRKFGSETIDEADELLFDVARILQLSLP